ncbi:MAG TPA: bluetail domain-containing putative surface protein [Rhizomicrobium sp.]|nr:bluetail domain-containing putative surface protein [Rhizomicrobium sp.]
MAKTILGTDDDDGLDGTNGNDVIIGYAGDDILTGNGGNDVLVGDLFATDRIQLVSTDGLGTQADDVSLKGHFSGDGTHVVFESDATNLIPGGDTIGVRDIFSKSLVDGSLVLVSSDSMGARADGDSFDASYAAKGAKIVFTTNADNLFTGLSIPSGGIDGNNADDVVIKDLLTGQITLVSTNRAGQQADGASGHASFSPDSGKVLFESDADNLVLSDTNGVRDIFLKNLATGTVRLVSTNDDGAQANGSSYNAVFSANGRMVAFESDATNLSSHDSNGVTDVYAKNLVDDSVILVSSSKLGVVGNAASSTVSFSSDGMDAIFTSLASNLVAHDTNGASDIFVKNLVTGTVRLVSSNADGVQGNGASFGGVFSPDGTKIAFYSNATNLVSGDTNGVTDVFVKDLITGDVTRVSMGDLGVQGDGASLHITWSPDGTQLVFDSMATNLLSDPDSNGTQDVFVATVDVPAAGNDILDGGNGDDTLLPGAGADALIGGAGDDVALFRDQLDSGDTFDGGTGNDTLVIRGNYSGGITLNAGVTNIETIRMSGPFAYAITAVNGNVAPGATMTVDGSAVDASHWVHFDGSAVQNGGAFNFIGSAGADVLKGGGNIDTFDMSAGGIDTVYGGGSVGDMFDFGAAFDAADTIVGGGDATLSLDGNYSSGVTFAGTTMSGVSRIALGAGHDYALTLSSNNMNLLTNNFTVDASGLGAGHALTFSGAAQSAVIFQLTGAAGNDLLIGGGAADDFDMSHGGNDTVKGGAGDDSIIFGDTLTNNDSVDGGTGYDTLYATHLLSARGGQMLLTPGFVKNVECIDLSGAQGVNFATSNTFLSSGQTLTINGLYTVAGFKFDGSGELDGKFSITGGQFADTLTGGAGDDSFDISAGGADTVNGGNGNDTISIASANSILTGMHLNGDAGFDILQIGGDLFSTATLQQAQLNGIEEIVLTGDWLDTTKLTTTDTAVAAGASLQVDASAFQGTFDFDGSAETNGKFNLTLGSGVGGITTGAGDDIVNGLLAKSDSYYNGMGGNDTITGGYGRDTLIGGSGNDVLQGSYAGDVITGGSGSDTFRYTTLLEAYDNAGSVETITDFDAASDKFDLWFSVTGINSTVSLAVLNAQTMQATLANALNAAHLGLDHAVLVKATAGDMAGTYLVVDGNGTAGYQANNELLFDITGATHLSNLSLSDFI